MTLDKRNPNVLQFTGEDWIKEQLLLSVLSGKPIRIVKIRNEDDNPGLREFEANLIRLITTISNGVQTIINETGTELFFQPGLLNGGKLSHKCCLDRGIGYYLEVLLVIGLFCKQPLDATLYGVTNNKIDPSVDRIKHSALPIIKQFIHESDSLSLAIKKRGVLPLGGGEIRFTCPIVRQLHAAQLLDYGLVKRIRGTAYVIRMSPAILNRVVEKAKGLMLKFCPDIFVTTDHNSGSQSGKSPGFGLSLFAETTTGVFYTSEVVSNTIPFGEEPTIPEDLGMEAARFLLDEVVCGGYVDSLFHWLVIILMNLCPKDVSKVVLGTLSTHTVQFLRLLRDFFGAVANLERFNSPVDDDDQCKKILVTCLGIGYVNYNKRQL